MSFKIKSSVNPSPEPRRRMAQPALLGLWGMSGPQPGLASLDKLSLYKLAGSACCPRHPQDSARRCHPSPTSSLQRSCPRRKGRGTQPLTSSCVSDWKMEWTPIMKGVGVLRTSRSCAGKMGTYVKLQPKKSITAPVQPRSLPQHPPQCWRLPSSLLAPPALRQYVPYSHTRFRRLADADHDHSLALEL